MAVAETTSAPKTETTAAPKGTTVSNKVAEVSVEVSHKVAEVSNKVQAASERVASSAANLAQKAASKGLFGQAETELVAQARARERPPPRSERSRAPDTGARLAQAIVPFKALRPGFRVVPLADKHGNRDGDLARASLLCFFSWDFYDHDE